MNHHGHAGRGHNSHNNGNAVASVSTTITSLKNHLSAYSQTLIRRCQRNHGWDESFVNRVFGAYCQFLELKVMLQDFDATILSPPGYVDVMWHEHILDTKNYLECCMLCCGGGNGLGHGNINVIHHNPDGGLDVPARMIRIRNTEIALKSRFANHEIDPIIWELPTNPTSTSTSAAAPAATTTTSTTMVTTTTGSNPPTTAMIPRVATSSSTSSSSAATTTTTTHRRRSSKRIRLQARLPIPPQTSSTANENGFFNVFVKTRTGKIITIRIHKRTTMLQVAHIIQDMDGSAPATQRLIYQGQQIFPGYPNMTAEMVQLQDDCTIHLVHKLRGC